MKNLFQILCFLVLFPITGFAQLAVSTPTLHATPDKATVDLSLENQFTQPVQSARIWVVLLDDQDKIVGQKAQWLTGKTKEGKPLKDGELQLQPKSESGQPQKFSLTVDTQRPASKTQIAFSRIVLADGTLADVRKDVKIP